MQSQSGVVIAAGQSLSGVLNLEGWVITGITIPGTWTTADLTIVASDTEGGTYVPVYDAAGTEMQVTVGGTSRHIAIAPDATRSLRYAKLRSGTAGVPVNQVAAATLMVQLAETGAS